MVLLEIILSTIAISLISLIGIVTFAIKEKRLNKILHYLVSFSIGGLIGTAFLHLIPEAIETSSINSTFLFVCGGIVLFLFIERVLHWRHCHEEHCAVHSFAYTNLIGESVHNFLDGVIIAGAFLLDFKIGLATTMAIIIHEIPHELGNFGILMYAGMTKTKALLFNFLTAAFSVLGGILGFFLLGYLNGILPIILALTAGGFIYIAASDLIPEIRKEAGFLKSIANIAIIILGIALMYFVTFLE